jgi:hypothetical protein
LVSFRAGGIKNGKKPQINVAILALIMKYGYTLWFLYYFLPSDCDTKTYMLSSNLTDSLYMYFYIEIIFYVEFSVINFIQFMSDSSKMVV